MELDSDGGAAAFPPMQERDGSRSRAGGRLVLVRSRCLRRSRPRACFRRRSRSTGCGDALVRAGRPAVSRRSLAAHRLRSARSVFRLAAGFSRGERARLMENGRLLNAVARVSLGEDPVDVVLSLAVADDEVLGDLAVGASIGGQVGGPRVPSAGCRLRSLSLDGAAGGPVFRRGPAPRRMRAGRSPATWWRARRPAARRGGRR